MACQNQNNPVQYFETLNKEINKATSVLAGHDELTIMTTEEKARFFEEIKLDKDVQETIQSLNATGQSIRFGMQQPKSDLCEYNKLARKVFDALS